MKGDVKPDRQEIPFSGLAFIGWLLLFTLVPFLVILGMSFVQKGGYGSLIMIPTIENYARLFQLLYFKVMWKTMVLAFLATVTCLMVGFPIAYYLARSQGAMKQVGLILLFIPFWTNFILRVYGIISIIGNNGILNHLLTSTGLPPVQILYTRAGVYLGLLYNYLPFLVVPIYSALEKLDPSFREASQDLGANRIQTFWRVTLPNVRNGVIIGSLFVFIPMMGEYVIPDLLGGAKEMFLGSLMVNQFFTMQDWPFGSAIAGLLSCFLLVALYLKSQNPTVRRLAGE